MRSQLPAILSSALPSCVLEHTVDSCRMTNACCPPRSGSMNNDACPADFNAYYMEQALVNLYNANYTNLEEPTSYSYQVQRFVS